MKKITKLCILILLIGFDSCNSYNYEEELSKVIKEANLARKNKFKNIRSNSDKLFFCLYDVYEDCTSVVWDPKKILWKDSTTNVDKITKFDNLFENIKDNGYCFPGSRHYSIAFYKNKVEIDQYFVDTSNIKGKAMFFDGGYQTSYYIDLKDWNSIIRNK